jgi:hypothetical protein
LGWWYIPLIPATQEADGEFKTRMRYIATPYLKKKNNKTGDVAWLSTNCAACTGPGFTPALQKMREWS